eukprot:6181047-Pleurochrysis_carterae.AAC.2
MSKDSLPSTTWKLPKTGFSRVISATKADSSRTHVRIDAGLRRVSIVQQCKRGRASLRTVQATSLQAHVQACMRTHSCSCSCHPHPLPQHAHGRLLHQRKVGRRTHMRSHAQTHAHGRPGARPPGCALALACTTRLHAHLLGCARGSTQELASTRPNTNRACTCPSISPWTRKHAWLHARVHAGFTYATTPNCAPVQTHRDLFRLGPRVAHVPREAEHPDWHLDLSLGRRCLTVLLAAPSLRPSRAGCALRPLFPLTPPAHTRGDHGGGR